jgi:group I intron endonuclease
MLIYVVTNTITGKRYVGQTRLNIQRRWKAHVNAAATGRSGSTALSRAIVKYGVRAFDVRVAVELAVGAAQADLDSAERRLIAELGTMVPAGYNLRAGGNGSGALHPDTRARMSAARMGKPMSAAARLALSTCRIGTKATAETRAKLSAAHTGRRLPESQRQKIRSAMKSRVFSPEHRRRISEAKRQPTHETREKLRRANLGKTASEETRAKLRAAWVRRRAAMGTV